jgi:hypothetical protein
MSAPTIAAEASSPVVPRPIEGVTAAPFTTQNTIPMRGKPPLFWIAGGAGVIAALGIFSIVVVVASAKGKSGPEPAGGVEGVGTGAPAAVATDPPPVAPPAVEPTVEPPPPSATAEEPKPPEEPKAVVKTTPRSGSSTKSGSGTKSGAGTNTGGGAKTGATPKTGPGPKTGKDIGY